MGNDSRRPQNTAAEVSAGWRDPARHGEEQAPLDNDVLAQRAEQEPVDAGLEHPEGDHPSLGSPS